MQRKRKRAREPCCTATLPRNGREEGGQRILLGIGRATTLRSAPHLGFFSPFFYSGPWRLAREKTKRENKRREASLCFPPILPSPPGILPPLRRHGWTQSKAACHSPPTPYTDFFPAATKEFDWILRIFGSPPPPDHSEILLHGPSALQIVRPPLPFPLGTAVFIHFRRCCCCCCCCDVLPCLGMSHVHSFSDLFCVFAFVNRRKR